jgi:hypothetical protein
MKIFELYIGKGKHEKLCTGNIRYREQAKFGLILAQNCSVA